MAGLALERLDIDDIAIREDLAQLALARPSHIVALIVPVSPLRRYGAAREPARLQADFGGKIIGVEDDGELPRLHIGQRRNLRESVSPIAVRGSIFWITPCQPCDSS